VATVREAVLTLERNPPSLLVAEYALSDGSWRDILSALRRCSSDAAILVTSPIADDHMWAEILNVGGFDMILQPFDPEEVIRVSTCASRDAGSKGSRRNIFAA
jgi:DNA-binding response OmpR family regulator